MSEQVLPENALLSEQNTLLSAEEQAAIYLTVGGSASEYQSFSDLSAADVVAENLKAQKRIYVLMDARTQGTYLLGGLAWGLAELVVSFDLNGLALEPIWDQRLKMCTRWEVYRRHGKEFPYPRNHWYLPDVTPVRERAAPKEIGVALIERLTPLVEEIAAQSGTGKGALWRLVTDSLAGAYLQAGKRLSCEDAAMNRARAIVEAVGKPLDNSQWKFQEYVIAAEESPTGQTLRSWFLVRGGCCRFHKLPDGAFCPSCVHVKEEKRRQRIEHMMCAHPQRFG